MNLPESPEEMQKEVARIEAEFTQQREQSWEKEKTRMSDELNAIDFPNDPELRELYFKSVKSVWVQGYATGSRDMAVVMARDLGMGALVDTMEKLGKLAVPPNPYN